MRRYHRWIGTLIMVFLLWFALTGVATQAIDLSALLSQAPASNPTMMAIRESIDGPPNQIVIAPPDYDAAAFAPGYSFERALARVVSAGHEILGPKAPLSFVELRILDGRAIGVVGSRDQVVRFAVNNGQRLPDMPAAEHGPVASAHQTAKHLHRLFFLGDTMLWLNALVAVGLCGMIVTGLIVYAQLVRARARLRRRALFWSAGGAWRSLHRGVSLVSAVFLLIVAVTGTLLSVDSFAFGLYRILHPERLVHGFSPVGTVGDYSAPLVDAAMPAMFETTVRAYHRAEGDRPIKVVRLRSFAGMPQGVIVAGGAATQQLIFNAATGARAGLSGPNYPYTGFPTGWQLHELLKRIHRGDVIGVPGRIVDLLAGLALAFLSVSGLWMYLEQWQRRRGAGRGAPFWR